MEETWKKSAQTDGSNSIPGNPRLGLSPFYFGINRSCDGNAGGSIFYFLWTDPAQTKNHRKGCPHDNPAMPMKMPFGPKSFQNYEWPMPNMLMGNLPGFETTATSLMKQTFKNKGVASIEEFREIWLESEVKMIGCQMTMDVFGFSKEDFIDGVEVGGAATFLEFAADSDIQLFV